MSGSKFTNSRASFRGSNKQMLLKPEKPEVFYEDNDDIPAEDDEGQKMSKKTGDSSRTSCRLQSSKLWSENPSLLNGLTRRHHPRMLASIKSHRNVVPAPGHWSLEREYLSSKRGTALAVRDGWRENLRMNMGPSSDKGFYPAKIPSITGASTSSMYHIKFTQYSGTERLEGHECLAGGEPPKLYILVEGETEDYV
ncbi:uncharacterized protein K452DRAFT_341252 [Aplosporella prunicola CBS 121167]|uniref:DUF382 domain-containing protein n=1 Tax=Aplosporella prunicola CBS 121167 TaxID=1176127 RepID=A0A6A6B219_9PEZI|nr:uncharacterized protein K452DRAFT_341252 [Aplosporella prunicola CBS 121167]KAF2137274.1 hypothetical protein K452DRAFT_341252 [Aplosporella prunicola CBS 121167]